MAKKNTGSNVTKAVAIGAGVAALSAAAYLLFGPEGKKHRKDLQSWMVKMKADVMEKMEEAKELSEETYHGILDMVEAKYRSMKNVNGADLQKEVAELKKNWKNMKRKAGTKLKKASRIKKTTRRKK